MHFVVNRTDFAAVIVIVRDDKAKKNQGRKGPFMRWEVKDDQIRIDGNEASATIPATVHEAGVLFLKVTLFRKLLKTLTNEMLKIQVTAEGLVMENIRLSKESSDMLLYNDPDQAPRLHPSVGQQPSESEPPNQGPRQLLLWDEADQD